MDVCMHTPRPRFMRTHAGTWLYVRPYTCISTCAWLLRGHMPATRWGAVRIRLSERSTHDQTHVVVPDMSRQLVTCDRARYSYMLHVTCYMLHVTCSWYMLHVTVSYLRSCTLQLHVTCYMLHVTCYMLHVPCYMFHVTCYMLHVHGTCYS